MAPLINLSKDKILLYVRPWDEPLLNDLSFSNYPHIFRIRTSFVGDIADFCNTKRDHTKTVLKRETRCD